ncbi:olfactory receptor 52J3-like [Engraulis encrasicolus]|uniref:olfactory receptor 52J3-like n=1 Tax=Engraulis encrasicolus TaxID=184585 RepID=UPI002FD2EF61
MANIVLNQTFSYELKIARFDIPPSAEYPIFIIGMLIYLFSIVSNLTILLLIATQKSLHKPMFYILFSLPLNDLIGITAMFPRMLIDIVTKENTVYYPTCVLQGFLLHMFGGGTLFVLAAMSFDRYLAICKPLRYHAIMSPLTVAGLLALAWGMDFAIVLVLFLLQARVRRCRSFIYNVYCSNFSLLNLSCGEDITVNNIYGLFVTAYMQIITIGVQLFSYGQILLTCVFNKQSNAKAKALNTCLAQIIVFLIYEFIAMFTILSNRFPDVPANARRAVGILIYCVVPVVNPIIYGMKTKDIRVAFLHVVRKNKSSLT